MQNGKIRRGIFLNKEAALRPRKSRAETSIVHRLSEIYRIQLDENGSVPIPPKVLRATGSTVSRSAHVYLHRIADWKKQKNDKLAKQ